MLISRVDITIRQQARKGRAMVTTLVGEEDVYGTAKEIKKKSVIV